MPYGARRAALSLSRASRFIQCPGSACKPVWDGGAQKLSSFFSEVGPVRRAFVVRHRVSRDSKGFGYVQ
jgi:hypothetical protein